MILDLARFIDSERPLWDEFEKMLERFDADARAPMTRFHKLEKTLEHQGVRLAVVNPAQLPVQLSRQYLDIKQRQLL
jgi:hypothetical protein